MTLTYAWEVGSPTLQMKKLRLRKVTRLTSDYKTKARWGFPDFEWPWPTDGRGRWPLLSREKVPKATLADWLSDRLRQWKAGLSIFFGMLTRSRVVAKPRLGLLTSGCSQPSSWQLFLSKSLLGEAQSRWQHLHDRPSWRLACFDVTWTLNLPWNYSPGQLALAGKIYASKVQRNADSFHSTSSVWLAVRWWESWWRRKPCGYSVVKMPEVWFLPKSTLRLGFSDKCVSWIW